MRRSSVEGANPSACAGREEIEAMCAQVKQAEGSLAFAQAQLENTVTRAPISGVILERNVERGEFVSCRSGA